METSTPVLIGVAGGSGSGKTTIVKKIQELAPHVATEVFHLDHYYRDLAHLDPESRDHVNFDHPDALEMDLIAKHIAALANGESINRPTYEFASHTRSSKVVELQPKDVILVDGIFALYSPDVRKHLTCGIFVDVGDDVRFIRRLKRDVSERGRSIDGVIKQYLATVKPMHDQFVAPTKKLADIVVYWDNYNERTIELISKMIQQNT
ncbi:MAG: uridine kinase [Proteobacteria bacterium]|nr:uridine kinase [Pseudomonadota bacterium]